MMKLFWIFILLCNPGISAQMKDDVIFQCESKFENLTLDLKSTKEKVTVLYSLSDGKTYVCEAPILFLDLSGAQVSKYEANIAFTSSCKPKFSSNLAKTIAAEVKLTVPLSKYEVPEISWVNYRKAQKCVAKRNLLREYFKNK